MRLAAATLAVVLSAAACSGSKGDRSFTGTPATPDISESDRATPDAPQAPHGERHSLVIDQSYAPGPSGEVYTEGARSEVILTGPDGSAQTLKGLQDATLTASLLPGRYLVQPGLRPCSGHCSQRLAARTATCETTVDVPATRQLRVRYVVDQGCTISQG